MLWGFSLLLASCDGAERAHVQLQEQTTEPSSSSLAVAQEVVVQDPYHSELADAPNYLVPESISVAPGVTSAPAPASVPAQRIVMDTRPDTDLTLGTSPADPTRLFWFSPDDELEVTLGSQQVAIEQARSYLKQHGLWLDEWEEPTVSVGSSMSGSATDYKVTSWLVLFPGKTVLPGISRTVSVRIGDENKPVGLSLRLPKAEPLPGKVVRLRTLDEVLQDPDAWKAGLPSSKLQEKAHGSVNLLVNGYKLVYERPLVAKEDYLAVPVYEFDVVVPSGEFAGTKGTWRVVAAKDTETAVMRGQEGEGSTSTTLPLPENYGPAHNFYWGLHRETYAAYKLDHVQEGDYDVTVVWVRVDQGKGRPFYESIYDDATTLARQNGIATDPWEFLRVVLVEATGEQKMIESRDLYFSSSVMG